MAHSHWEGGPPCDLSTKKACEDRYADWQAMQQVLLAYNAVIGGRGADYKKESSQFAQLVQWLAGDREDIMNEDGNPSQAPWVVRLRAAVERVRSGDLPGYTMYTPAVPADEGEQ